ncbi:hypothetical protein PYW07_009777 [Mythimna separata]|uniref:Uncharacterized protein n=1 Tax=Mythimna separata TaxID=271217 RepID=A0AAD7YCH5_MYTSE|nr:hypothetical protein PYW07_009777 [Mythimna separata]
MVSISPIISVKLYCFVDRRVFSHSFIKMKITLFVLALCLAVTLAAAVRNHSDKRHILINRPKFDEFGPVGFGPRLKRTPWPLMRDGWVKGGVKGRPVEAPPSSLEMNLRKGEYVCEGRVCKLVPGVEPKGCNGVCQYPVL